MSAHSSFVNPFARAASHELPGQRLSLGFTLTYLSLIVLIPISALFIRTFQLSFEEIWAILTRERTLHAMALTFSTSLTAAAINAFFGTAIAWTLCRYSFPGKKALDTLIDLPFALPTAIAGIALTTLYARNGVLGESLEQLGIKVAFNPIGIVVALVFIGIPFVVRTLQPVIDSIEKDLEEAACTLGASRIRTLYTIILPSLYPSILTGFTLAFARGLGEYGSVIFISGNMPMKTEIAPLLMVTQLEQYDYPAATAIAFAMLMASFLCLLSINLIQRFASKRSGHI